MTHPLATNKPKFAALMLAITCVVQAADPARPTTTADRRDWRLSDLRKVIKASGKNLPEIITGISIVDEDTLIVYLSTTRKPLSGMGADVTLKFSKERGWKVTKTTFSDR
ncbi:MAG: hypothetical protein ACKVY0_21920 [Prosthecobacter sp.]|uniref:hypothetical protein n=1 Tax=Prosthecobacter sp. TaxID=1965333 RepID=UPI0038FE67DB